MNDRGARLGRAGFLSYSVFTSQQNFASMMPRYISRCRSSVVVVGAFVTMVRKGKVLYLRSPSCYFVE